MEIIFHFHILVCLDYSYAQSDQSSSDHEMHSKMFEDRSSQAGHFLTVFFHYQVHIIYTIKNWFFITYKSYLYRNLISRLLDHEKQIKTVSKLLTGSVVSSFNC